MHWHDLWSNKEDVSVQSVSHALGLTGSPYYYVVMNSYYYHDDDDDDY